MPAQLLVVDQPGAPLRAGSHTRLLRAGAAPGSEDGLQRMEAQDQLVFGLERIAHINDVRNEHALGPKDVPAVEPRVGHAGQTLEMQASGNRSISRRKATAVPPVVGIEIAWAIEVPFTGGAKRCCRWHRTVARDPRRRHCLEVGWMRGAMRRHRRDRPLTLEWSKRPGAYSSCECHFSAAGVNVRRTAPRAPAW